MAARNGGTGTGRGRKPAGGTRRRASAKKPAGLIFWAVFFLVVAFLFLANREAIRRTLQNTRFLERLSGRQDAARTVPPPENTDGGGVETREYPEAEGPPELSPPALPPAGPAGPAAVPSTPESPAPANPPAAPPERRTEAGARPPAAPAARPIPETGERGIYFTQIDKDGTVLRTRAARKIPASDSPLLDALAALLAGPTAEEQRRGLRSLVPGGTRVLSALVRGSTAYISFSEEFQYNTYGVEGYAAQLRQIIWTATEFSNVTDVQILIEGRRVDYLGEGIWIGSPLGRDAL
ncbi:MAG: GerMN domain-containing protein [Treponema sp.]|nr:GerMN domain-containing protein [Treponema sp.]